MPQITFLSSMAGADLAIAARRHRELGISILDIKDGVFGNRIEDLTPAMAERAAAVVEDAGCTVYCLSSSIGFSDLAEGQESFARRHLEAMRDLLTTASILKPTVIRLLAPRTQGGMNYSQAIAAFPWTIGIYQQLIDLLADAGFDILIENEVHGCILATPDDIHSFIQSIDRPGQVKIIYDVQNLWQMGWFPTIETVSQLAPIMGGLHLKGGRCESGTDLVWASPLETASWPVIELTRAVLEMGTVPVICLNPSHGRQAEGYNVWDVGQQDLRFLRRHFPELA